jgi:opacity protein-like surface antigen
MKMSSFVTTALLGAAGLALIAAPASAQPNAAATYDWSGPYVGLNAGWNSANTTASPSSATTNQLTGVSAGGAPVTVAPATFPTAQMDYSSSSWAAGGQIGFNHQMGNIVLGVEGDMDGVGGRSRQFSSYALPATALTSANGVTIERQTDPNWTASVRGRVGWAMDRFLIYGTGGLAIADARQTAFYSYTPTVTGAVAAANPGTTFPPSFNAASEDRTMVGWTVGAGGEYAINRAVSIGAEYRHSDYGSHTYGLGDGAPGDTREFVPIGMSDDQVLAKVNFRFGPGMF